MEDGDLVKLNCFKNGKDEAMVFLMKLKKIKKNFLLIILQFCKSNFSNKRI